MQLQGGVTCDSFLVACGCSTTHRFIKTCCLASDAALQPQVVQLGRQVRNLCGVQAAAVYGDDPCLDQQHLVCAASQAVHHASSLPHASYNTP